MNPLLTGKLPPDVLARILSRAPVNDARVVLPPGPGRDCAVLDMGERLLVLKSDPITFATDEIGWYLVQVNANDIATTGAVPRWLMLTMLLPAGATTAERVETWAGQVYDACAALGISVIGGHTEVTHGLKRPILVGTMLGEVERERLVRLDGARPGDRVLLTKGVPIEGTALAAREFSGRLAGVLTREELKEAQGYLRRPGISVLRDAQVALGAGRVTAMHDPTEGGLAGALWELAEACGCGLEVDLAHVPVPPLAAKVCAALGLNPLRTIASGALLLTVEPGDAAAIAAALEAEGIECADIGTVRAGQVGVVGPDGRPVARPARDEMARLFEESYE